METWTAWPSEGEVMAYAISEHIEFAGVHSGDATMQLPPQKLYVETVRRIKRVSRKIAQELHISGPFNIQFMARENDIRSSSATSAPAAPSPS
jgi:carbamoyl-phosphate synthase large subunit